MVGLDGGGVRGQSALRKKRVRQPLGRLSCLSCDGLVVEGTQMGPGGTGYNVIFSWGHRNWSPPCWEVFWPMAVSLSGTLKHEFCLCVAGVCGDWLWSPSGLNPSTKNGLGQRRVSLWEDFAAWSRYFRSSLLKQGLWPVPFHPAECCKHRAVQSSFYSHVVGHYLLTAKWNSFSWRGGRGPLWAVFGWLEQYYGTCALKSCWTDKKTRTEDIQFWLLIKRDNSPFSPARVLCGKPIALHVLKNVCLNGCCMWGKWGGKWGWWFVSSLRWWVSPASAE